VCLWCACGGVQVKTALVEIVYAKSLRLSNAARQNKSVGEIVTLMQVCRPLTALPATPSLASALAKPVCGSVLGRSYTNLCAHTVLHCTVLYGRAERVGQQTQAL